MIGIYAKDRVYISCTPNEFEQRTVMIQRA